VTELGVVDGQLGLFPEPTRLFSCTPSRLVAFEDCPRRYRFTYLDRPPPPKGPPWAHNSLGASVHTALRAWFDLPAPQRQPAAVEALLRPTWVRDGYRDEDQERQAFHRARQWLLSYVERLDPAFEPLGVERTVATKTATLALSGRVDRIDEVAAEAARAPWSVAASAVGPEELAGPEEFAGANAAGDLAEAAAGDRPGPRELVIVDYKTGRTGLGPDDARSSRALALYAVAAARVFRRPCRRVELHHLPSGTVAAHEHTEESLARHLRRAEQTAQDAVAAEKAMQAGTDPDTAFPANPGAICGWCDFRRSCPAGASRAGHESWAGLDRGIEAGDG
jgi:RecB family exonuclease